MYDASGYNEDYAQNGGAGAGGFHFKTGEGMDFSDLFSSFFGGSGGNGGSGGSFAFNFGGPSGGGMGGGSPFGFEGFGGPEMGGNGRSGGRGSKGHQQYQQQNMYGGHHQHQPSQQQRQKQAKPQKVFVDLEALMDDSFHTVTLKKGGRSSGTVELEVPKGCPEGHVIEEQGQRFAIHTNPNKDFVRGMRSHKSDLYANVSITLEQALLGFTLELLTIDGELIEEEIESMPHSMEYQIKRKGLPRFDAKATTRGHLYVRFDVQYPTLSAEEKKEMKARQEREGSWDYSEARKYREKEDKKRLRREQRRNRNKSEL